jgi:hypothetical protein
MSAATDRSLDEILAERDALLTGDGDPEAVRAFLLKNGDAWAAEADLEMLRAAWHKARTAVTSFPEAERRKSIAWLTERGLSHFAEDLK